MSRPFVLAYLVVTFIHHGQTLPYEFHAATTTETVISKVSGPKKYGSDNISQSEDTKKEMQESEEPPHISDFTNPETGHNPFLDLPEGTVTGSSRQGATIPDKPIAAPKRETETSTPPTLPPYHRLSPPDIIEGHANPRQKPPFDLGQSIDEGTSRGRIHMFPTNLSPPRDFPSTTTRDLLTVKLFRNIKPSTTRKCEPSKPLPITQDYKQSASTSTTPATVKRREDATKEKNVSSSSINRNFTIGITIVGVAIVFFAIMLATCLWKQKTKQVPPRHTSLRNMLNTESVKRGMIHT